MSHRRPFVAAASLAFVLAVTEAPVLAAVTTTYDFSTVTGSTTPLGLNGATFTSPSDPGAYSVGPNGGLYETLPATVLSSAGTVAALDITFAAPISGISFDFALGDFLAFNGDDSLTLTVDGKAPVVFNAVLGGSALFPAGSVAYSGPSFSHVTLNSAEPLAIGNLATVGAVAAVPEPSSALLLAGGLAGVGGFARLRRRLLS